MPRDTTHHDTRGREAGDDRTRGADGGAAPTRSASGTSGSRSGDRTGDGQSTPDRGRRSALTRRTALGVVGGGLFGAGLLGGATGSATADEHDAEVWSEGGTWHADAHGSSVYSGDDMFAAVQTAVDGLTSGRSSKETVVVRDGGTASGTVGLPSYTAVDFRGEIDHRGDDMPFYADSVEAIEIANLTIDTTAGMGMRIQRCTDVTLGTIEITGGPGLGIRIDGNRSSGLVPTEHVSISEVYVEGTGSHGVETYNVDDIEIGTVTARDTGGCGLLLNATSNADVGVVDAVRANEGGGYAGFRCANDAGPNIHVDEVYSTNCGRGIFTVSNSRGITVEYVELEGNGGNLIQNTQDVNINGGVVRDNGGEGFRVDSRNDGSHHPSRNVTIQNCGIYEHDYGVRETGPDTGSNAIVGNDFCDNGTDVETYADDTIVEDNTSCEGPPDGSDPCDDAEPTAIDPYVRVDGGEWENVDVVEIDSGSVVEFGPHPTSADGWSWDGPGVSGSSREIEVSPTEDATYTATYTNDCDVPSSQAFTVTVVDDEPQCANAETLSNGQTVCDVDGDGQYRDVTGDESVTNSDVTQFFSNQHVDPWDSRPDLFDFDGDDTVSQADVIDLFAHVAGR